MTRAVIMAAGALSTGVLLLGALFTDSIVFDHVSLTQAAARLSPWLYASLIVLVVLTAYTNLRWPRTKPSEPEESTSDYRVWIFVREVALMAAALAFVAVGDVRISEWLQRSLAMIPWFVAIRAIGVGLDAWRASEANRLALARYEGRVP